MRLKGMGEILTISVNKGFKKKVEQAAEMLRVSKSELVKKAIEKYIAHEELRTISSLLVPCGEKAGYYTDEDIFHDIS